MPLPLHVYFLVLLVLSMEFQLYFREHLFGVQVQLDVYHFLPVLIAQPQWPQFAYHPTLVHIVHRQCPIMKIESDRVEKS